MNLRQIQQFAVLAETMNFRRAAERLHIAQPPLSVSIKRLEDELGAPLFLRERRGLRLTAVGHALLPAARQIASLAQQMKVMAAFAAGGAAGQLRIGFVGSATYRMFPRALPEFRRRYPQVELVLRESTTTQMLRQVERGEIDVGLVRYPVVEETSARMVPVEFDRLVAAVPSAFPVAARRRLRLAALRDEPFILYSAAAAHNLRAQVLAACQQAGFAPMIVQEAVQVQTLLSLVASGIGVALVPSVSQALGTPGVTFRSLTDGGAGLDVALAAAIHPREEPPAAARFIELLQELDPVTRPGRPIIRPPA